MTESEKIAALKAGGWKEVEPGMWKNTVAFDYKDITDPGKDDTGRDNRHPKTREIIGRVKVVPVDVTRTTTLAYELEKNRPAMAVAK